MQGELDELEREEFFRLKKVQDKKQRDTKQKLKDRENTFQPSYTSPAEAIALPQRTSWESAPPTKILAGGDDIDLFAPVIILD